GFFFSQAEDGIRSFHVTGVQTCALPISSRCVGSGRPLTSTTLSSIRVKTLTTSRNSSQSKYARSLKGATTNFVRFTEPSRQAPRSEEHTSELQSRENLVCRLLLEKKKNT